VAKNAEYNNRTRSANVICHWCSASLMKSRRWLPSHGATQLLRSSPWRWSHQAD